MKTLTRCDNQAVSSRFGQSAMWLTDFVTPDNPDVQLLHQELTEGVESKEDRIIALWEHVARIPYREIVGAALIIQGKTYRRADTWLLPSEVAQLAPVANCANKSFLLTSLVRNELPVSQVKCVMGNLHLEKVGAHAWVEADIFGETYILEGTQPDIDKALVPALRADAYEGRVYFDDFEVYTVPGEVDVEAALNERYGFCAASFLKEYLCERCRGLGG